MAKKTEQPAESGSKKTPDFIAYVVIDRGEDQKGIWRSIGSAWAHNDGKGFQVRLDAFPVDGIVTLRVPPPKSDA